MELKKELEKALSELRKERKRNFNQSVDLIINLQKFDIKKNSINLFIQVPHKIKDKKICAFLENKNKNIDTITKDEFKKYSTTKGIKKLKKYDFFISQANLMPLVATNFGRILGPAGKMPSPQLGILKEVNDKIIKETVEKINSSLRIRTKEPSIKMCVGKETMKNEEIIENILSVYNALLKELQKGKENIKNLEIKLTMTKPIKINVK